MTATWTSFKIKRLPGVIPALGYIETAAHFLVELLNIVKSLLDAAKTILVILADAIEGAIATAMSLLQEAINAIYDIMNTGVYSYTDRSILWKSLADGGDGVSGFLARWSASFDDEGNGDRPQFSEDAAIWARPYFLAVNNLPDLAQILELFGKLFDVPSLVWMADKVEVDMPARIERGTSTPPDWESTTLLEVLKPLGQVMELLRDAAGLLTLGSALAAAIEALVAAIQAKITTLTQLVAAIEEFVATIEALLESGIYILRIEETGLTNLKAAALAAEPPSGLSPTAYVIGGCFLVGTAGGSATINALESLGF